MSTPKNEPAFPTTGSEYISNSDPQPTIGLYGGITIRDYFAAKAIAAVVRGFWNFERTEEDYEEVAKMSYKIADAMLKQREL